MGESFFEITQGLAKEDLSVTELAADANVAAAFTHIADDLEVRMHRYKDERRLKLLAVPPIEVLKLLSSNGRSPRYIQAFECPDLPDGCQVRGVEFSFPRGVFCFAIWHPTFDPVPLNEEIPQLNPLRLFRSKVVYELMKSPGEEWEGTDLLDSPKPTG